MNQLRTNEIALVQPHDLPWELREFRLATTSQDGVSGPDTGLLRSVTVKQNPAMVWNDTQKVTDFIDANERALTDPNGARHDVPLEFPVASGDRFLGGAAPTPTRDFFWNGVGLVPGDDRRHKFSLSTCSGCHGGETATKFTHIKPAPFGTAAGLSDFLTGKIPAGRDGVGSDFVVAPKH